MLVNIRYYSHNMSTIPYGKIYRPDAIDVVDGWVVWRRPGQTGQANWVRCTDRTLSQFAVIKTEQDVLRFAARYGVFGAKKLMDDGAPLANELSLEPAAGRWCVSVMGARDDKEPTWIWGFLSRQVRAMLRVNSALKGRARQPIPTPGEEQDWSAIVGGEQPFTGVRDAQYFLMLAVNRWLITGGVGLALGLEKLSKTETKWRVEVECGPVGGYNLFGQLAYQLFLAIAGEDRLYACCGCGNPYVRTKKAPRAGQDNYCEGCTSLAKVRATQRYRNSIRRSGGDAEPTRRLTRQRS
jgi:hypothetical protein